MTLTVDLALHHTEGAEAREERERVALGLLPARYGEPWAEPVLRALEPALVAGVRILDVGSGRRPTLGPEFRPVDCHYVGLDVSAAELEAAPRGSYAHTVVADAGGALPDLEGQFDLVISWQTLEHVPSLPAALTNLRLLLRPGGRMVSLLSGRYAVFALAARFVPHRLAVSLMTRLMNVAPESKFPTRYDHCYYSALTRLLADWAWYQIIPRYKGGAYFRFFRPLERTYLAYENLLYRHDVRNLATHYVVVAGR